MASESQGEIFFDENIKKFRTNSSTLINFDFDVKHVYFLKSFTETFDQQYFSEF